MDRRVKERLVGASILVAFIVLVAPELLSGPKPAAVPGSPASVPEPVRNVTVDLAASQAAATGSAAGSTPVPAAPASPAASPAAPAAPAPAAAPAGTAAGAPPIMSSPPQAVHEEAASAPSEALESAPPSPIFNRSAEKPSVTHAAEPASVRAPVQEGHRAWAVQLGSFASRANADKLWHQLKARGFSPYVQSSGSKASARYRVRIGPMADREAAERMVAKLKAQGHPSSIVPPAR